ALPPSPQRCGRRELIPFRASQVLFQSLSSPSNLLCSDGQYIDESPSHSGVLERSCCADVKVGRALFHSKRVCPGVVPKSTRWKSESRRGRYSTEKDVLIPYWPTCAGFGQ